MVLSTLLLPMVGALVVLVVPPRFARATTLATAGLLLATVAALLAGRAAPRQPIDPWHEVDVAWIDALDVRFHLGVDGLSWPLLALTALLVAGCMLWLSAPEPRLRALVLLAAGAMLGVFLALDLVLFTVFFELTLLPMYAIIAGWGGAGAKAAARKFVLYTLLGSALLLTGVLLLLTQAGTGSMIELAGGHELSRSLSLGIFVLLLVAFAVKSPLWPLHTWLPDAHTAAPTIGSVLLAGVLLKLGSYGLIRLGVTLLPDAARRAALVVGVLGAVAVVMGALLCLTQTDLKRLIAYSSVGHMGFVLLGIATLTVAGLQAAVIGNIAHGLTTSLLFFGVGYLGERFGTRRLDQLRGLRAVAPRVVGIAGFAAAASFGLPGLAGFWGEFFAVLGAGQRASLGWWIAAALAAIGAALTVAYFLRVLRTFATEPAADELTATTVRAGTVGEVVVVAGLIGFIILIGVWPGVVWELTAGPIEELVG